MTKKYDKEYELDAEEQEIEDNFEFLVSIENAEEVIKDLQKAAKKHIQKKKSITIRVSIQDLEAIKAKALKLGLPYQTYLNMIIHLDATNQKLPSVDH
jgi:predicted DNA binding CopG/RHH family protein